MMTINWVKIAKIIAILALIWIAFVILSALLTGGGHISSH